MKSLRGPSLRIFALVLSLIVIGIGLWQIFFQGQGYEKTTATITSIEERGTTASDDKEYDVTVRFTVDGKEYSGLLGSYSSGYKVGKTVAVKYDPSDPSRFLDASGSAKIFLIVGVAILAVDIIAWIMSKKSQQKLEEARSAAGGEIYAPSVPGPERELYFITDLFTPKFGHRIEDRSRHVLYEAKMTKFSILQPCGFDFIDHEHNRTMPHLIGHQENTEWDSLLFDDHSTFTFDGEYIWKHLKRNGITVDSTLSRENLLKAQFTIFRDGVKIAMAQASGQYVHEEDAAKHGKLANAVPAFGHYRVHTTETNLDLLFLTLVAFARTDATTAEGGNRKTVWNAIKQG